MNDARTVGAPRRRTLVVGGVQALAADGLVIPTGIVIAAVMARVVGADGYGVLALALTVVGTIEWGLTALLSRASVVLVGEADDSRRAGASILRIHWRLGTAGTVAAALAAWPAARVFDDARVGWCLLILAAEVAFVTAAAGCRSILAGRGQFGARAMVGAIRWTTRLVAIVGLVVAGWSVWGAAFGNVIAAAVSLMVARWAVGAVPPDVTAPASARFWSMAWPTFLLAMSLRLLDKVGLMAVRVFGGSVEDAGFYAAAQNFAMAPGLATMALSPLILGAVSRARAAGHDDSARLIGRDALRLMVLFWPFLTVVGVSALEIVTLVFGERFAPAAPLAAPFLASAAALAVITVASTLLTAREQAHVAVRSAWPVLPAALLGFGLTVPAYGPWGAALSTAVAASAGAGLSLLAVKRAWGVGVPLSTALRSAAVSAAVVVAATLWPASGVEVFVRMVVLSLGGGLTLALLGEFRGEWAAFRASQRPRG